MLRTWVWCTTPFTLPDSRPRCDTHGQSKPVPHQDSSPSPGTQKSAPSSTVPASAQEAANRFSVAAVAVEHAATGAGRAAADAGHAAAVGQAATNDAGHAAAESEHATTESGRDAGHAAADAVPPAAVFAGMGHAAMIVGAGQAAAL